MSFARETKRINEIGNNLEKIDESFSLSPNPFNYTLNIQVILETESDVSISIYNTNGEMVFAENKNDLPEGAQQFTWNGNHSNGQQLSNGIYLVSIRAGNEINTQKIILQK